MVVPLFASKLRNDILTSLRPFTDAPIYTAVSGFPAASNSETWAVILSGAEEGIYLDQGTWTRRGDTQAFRAETAAEAAEAAKDAALAGLTAADVYTDTTIAAAKVTGLAAVAEGETFYATGDDVDYVGLYKDLAGVATEIVRIAKPSALDDAVALASSVAARATVGAAAVANAGTGTAASFSYMNQEASPIAGRLTEVTLYTASNVEMSVFVATDDGSNFATRVQTVRVYAIAGVNTYKVDLPIAVGQIVGFHGPSTKQTGTGKAAYYKSGLLGLTTEAVTAAAGYGLQFSAKIVSEIGDSYTIASGLGNSERIGRAVVSASGGTVGAGFFVANYNPATLSGFVTEVDVSVVNETAAAKLAVVSMNADGTVNLVESRTVSLSPGINRIRPQGLAIAAGQYVGVLASGSLVQNTTTGEPVFYITGLPGTSTSKAILNNYGIEIGVTIEEADRAAISQSGSSVASGIVADGTTDATTAIKRLQPNGAYLPRGTYAATSLRHEGLNLSGPGDVLLNGRKFFLPAEPSTASLLRRFRSEVARQIGDLSGLAFIGDSITLGQDGTSDWLYTMPYLVSGFANSTSSPNDTPIMNSFQISLSAMGITMPATPAYGGTGPQGMALTLADGETLTLDAGNFRIVDVFYDRAVSAGSLAFAFNGAAAYKTVSCAGSVLTDETTYTGAGTGQTTSGVYTITASGGPVIITGLIRLGELVDTFRGRLPVYNFGRNSQAITGLTATRIASMKKQMAVFGGSAPGAVLIYGENDQISTLPATIYTNFTAKIDELVTAGFKSIWGCGILKPASSTYTYAAGCSYRGANGAVRAAFEDKGVPFIKLDAVEFSERGLSPDGVHPNDAGTALMAQLIIEDMAE